MQESGMNFEKNPKYHHFEDVTSDLVIVSQKNESLSVISFISYFR